MNRNVFRIFVAMVLLAAASIVSTPFSMPATAAGSTLTVNVDEPFRPVTRVASGGLYGLASGDRPPDSLLYPIGARTLVQPPPGTQHRPNGQPPDGDSLVVAPQAGRVGAAITVRFPDIYPTFPYQWVSMSDWLAKVDQMVNDRLNATSVSNVEAYELWNEPDYTWDSGAAGPFNDFWVTTFERVRDLDPVTPIAGPSIASWNESWMRSFLIHARDTGTLPEIIIWHELQGAPQIGAHVAAYRALEDELGISDRPVFINEYGAPDEIYVPGRVASYIAKFERAGVEAANRAFWDEYGTMNGLVVNDSQPTASWWLYKWYGDMAGNMVTTVPQSQSALDGFASHDSTRDIVHVVFGNESGTNSVQLNGLDTLGSNVRVRLESTPNSGRFTAVSSPTVHSDTTQSVSGGQLTVSVPNMDAGRAYHLIVEPADGVSDYQQRYEAENASVFNAERFGSTTASNGGYVGLIDNSGDFRNDSYVDFIVDVPTAGGYEMDIGYSNGTDAISTHGLAYNGGSWSTVSYPVTGEWGELGNTVSTTVDLDAGYNVIRLAKGAPSFSGGDGYAELDYIELTSDTAPPPDDDPSIPGVASIVAQHSDKCLDVEGYSTADGGNVFQWECHGDANQQWELRDVGDGFYELVSMHSGKCLDVEGISTADGANVFQWECLGGANQQWELRDVGGGLFEIVARHSGKCLDVSGVSTDDGANLQQYSCWGGQNQRFSLNGDA